jgi:hypothetical protein
MPRGHRYVDIEECNNYIMNWFGLLPMQLSQTTIVVFNAVHTIPVDPAPRALRLHQFLQHILWREEETVPMDGDGPSQQPPQGGGPAGRGGGSGARGEEAEEAEGKLEPIFCFETALKALYW